MTCRTTIRRFDGDQSATLRGAVFVPGAVCLRFVSWVTLDKGTGRYAEPVDAPALSLAWVSRERISDETSSVAEITAALADVDQIPLVIENPGQSPWGWRSDDGGGFPTVSIKGTPMALVLLVEAIKPGTHGQLTFGWGDTQLCSPRRSA